MSLRIAIAMILAGVTAGAAFSQEEVRTEVDGGVMIRIPAGPFTYGITPFQFAIYQTPVENAHLCVRRGKLPAYLIDKAPVSVAQYQRYLDATGNAEAATWNRFRWPDDSPARDVSWEEAGAYAQWAGKRLATSLEWEKAARGPKGGNLPYEDDALRALPPTITIDSFPVSVSEYGMQMRGNCKEWVEDIWHHDLPYCAPAKDKPGVLFRVTRSGGWASAGCHWQGDFGGFPTGRALNCGFRCARSE